MNVLILDGIWGNHSRWKRLARTLEARGANAKIWGYDNSGKTGLAENGRLLRAELRKNKSPTHLVGYSMGGLVLREALRKLETPAIGKVATINSPHEGSLFACAVDLPATRDMRPGSPFLRALAAADWPFPTLAVWCPLDLAVFPGASARWKKASLHIRSDIPAHVWPVFSPSLHRKIADFLLGPRGEQQTFAKLARPGRF